MIRQAHLIAVVGVLLIGCAVLVVAGCSGVRTGAPQEEKQGHTEATKEQGRSPEATASEEARCEGTRTYHLYVVVYPNEQNSLPRSGSEEDMKKADKKPGQWTDEVGVYATNDLPGCPKGGLLLGTDKPDLLNGKHGDDEVRGLGGRDELEGGPGNDILYGGDGDDTLEPPWVAGKGEDVMYGGDGNDFLTGGDGRDKLYCGEGKDRYLADKIDYVDSSCEKREPSSYVAAG